MDICRICLASKPDKDINELNTNKGDDAQNFADILLFCLDIQISQDSTDSRKLCKKCYKKILSFYDFKSLALRNDAYLRTIRGHKLEIFLRDCQEIDVLNTIDSSNVTVKEEPEPDIKTEDDVTSENGIPDCQSDDEVLSVIKKIKYESSPAKNGVIASFVIKKSRGRPKQIKKKEICEECGKEVWDLKKHAIMHRPVHERKSIKCKECDKLFSSYSARYKHHKIKHLGIKQHCDICNKDVVSLMDHTLVMHRTEDLRFPCLLCDRRFIYQSLLDVHMMIHTKDRPFECDICGKKFRTKPLMSAHKRQVHNMEKTHLCQFCSKSFFKKYHLQIHLRTHTKEKPYNCTACGKFFSSSTALKSHQMTHSTVNRFACPHCDSTFLKPSYLKTHLICHTREKRHACKYCGVKFGRSDHRKRHEFTVHEKFLHLLPSAVV
ncbi:zinc finger protein 557-like isoform X1 [Hyposmocoma kahamanoa]|uniref:zinc finger protein 557-like isoform X1 n=1 Tax=Hyposmocoma kahamanoa TaxID=1477025 RepID=UPI000E6D6443|nr:zinc finger protein 557-like isoform X1 [Hyposmocoma kahamanoa]